MPSKRRSNHSLCAFLGLLWLGATFAYLGNTGKHSDDYWATLWSIDGEHLDWTHTPWSVKHYFWRPLHLIHIWFNNTVFWSHDWVPHLELALVHGLVCILLYRLLVRLNSARAPALCAALLFGTFPLLGEAINWNSASCNAIGAALMLWTLLLVQRFASREPGTSVLAPLAAIAALAFAAPCFYEPAGAGLAVVPVIAWVGGAVLPAPVRLRRTAWATAADGIPCILYVILLVRTSPHGARGSTENIVHASSLPAAAAHFFFKLRMLLWGPRGHELTLGCVEQGWDVILHRTTITAIVVATAIAGIAALVRLSQARDTAEPTGPDRSPRGALPVIGLLLFFVPFAPFIATAPKGVELRSIYVSMLGVAFIVAGAGNALRRISLVLEPAVRQTLTIATLALVGLAAIAGQVGLIGFQSQFRANDRLDRRVAAQLAQLASRVEPQTVFMILDAEHRGAATSHGVYNRAIHTALEAPWSANPFLRRALKRQDVHVLAAPYWQPRVIPAGNPTRTDLHFPRDDGGYARSWSDIVPVWIDPNANVHIVDTITIQPRDGEAFRVVSEGARRLAGPGGEWLRKPGSAPFRLIDLDSDHCRVERDAAATGPLEQTSTVKQPIIPGTEPATHGR